VDAQIVKREKRFDLLWDLRNSMLLAPEPCHSNHTNAHRRIALSAVPLPARAFAIELLGEDRAILFFTRTYRA
jgi:hypothetical protein